MKKHSQLSREKIERKTGNTNLAVYNNLSDGLQPSQSINKQGIPQKQNSYQSKMQTNNKNSRQQQQADIAPQFIQQSKSAFQQRSASPSLRHSNLPSPQRSNNNALSQIYTTSAGAGIYPLAQETLPDKQSFIPPSTTPSCLPSYHFNNKQQSIIQQQYQQQQNTENDQFSQVQPISSSWGSIQHSKKNSSSNIFASKKGGYDNNTLIPQYQQPKVNQQQLQLQQQSLSQSQYLQYQQQLQQYPSWQQDNIQVSESKSGRSSELRGNDIAATKHHSQITKNEERKRDISPNGGQKSYSIIHRHSLAAPTWKIEDEQQQIYKSNGVAPSYNSVQQPTIPQQKLIFKEPGVNFEHMAQRLSLIALSLASPEKKKLNQNQKKQSEPQINQAKLNDLIPDAKRQNEMNIIDTKNVIQQSSARIPQNKYCLINANTSAKTSRQASGIEQYQGKPSYKDGISNSSKVVGPQPTNSTKLIKGMKGAQNQQQPQNLGGDQFVFQGEMLGEINDFDEDIYQNEFFNYKDNMNGISSRSSQHLSEHQQHQLLEQQQYQHQLQIFGDQSNKAVLSSPTSNNTIHSSKQPSHPLNQNQSIKNIKNNIINKNKLEVSKTQQRKGAYNNNLVRKKRYELKEHRQFQSIDFKNSDTSSFHLANLTYNHPYQQFQYPQQIQQQQEAIQNYKISLLDEQYLTHSKQKNYSHNLSDSITNEKVQLKQYQPLLSQQEKQQFMQANQMVSSLQRSTAAYLESQKKKQQQQQTNQAIKSPEDTSSSKPIPKQLFNDPPASSNKIIESNHLNLSPSQTSLIQQPSQTTYVSLSQQQSQIQLQPPSQQNQVVFTDKNQLPQQNGSVPSTQNQNLTHNQGITNTKLQSSFRMQNSYMVQAAKLTKSLGTSGGFLSQSGSQFGRFSSLLGNSCSSNSILSQNQNQNDQTPGSAAKQPNTTNDVTPKEYVLNLRESKDKFQEKDKSEDKLSQERSKDQKIKEKSKEKHLENEQNLKIEQFQNSKLSNKTQPESDQKQIKSQLNIRIASNVNDSNQGSSSQAIDEKQKKTKVSTQILGTTSNIINNKLFQEDQVLLLQQQSQQLQYNNSINETDKVSENKSKVVKVTSNNDQFIDKVRPNSFQEEEQESKKNVEIQKYKQQLQLRQLQFVKKALQQQSYSEKPLQKQLRINKHVSESNGVINCIAFDGNNKLVFTGSSDYNLRCFDANSVYSNTEEGNLIQNSIYRHRRQILSIDYNKMNNKLLTSCQDGIVRFFDCKNSIIDYIHFQQPSKNFLFNNLIKWKNTTNFYQYNSYGNIAQVDIYNSQVVNEYNVNEQNRQLISLHNNNSDDQLLFLLTSSALLAIDHRIQNYNQSNKNFSLLQSPSFNLSAMSIIKNTHYISLASQSSNPQQEGQQILLMDLRKCNNSNNSIVSSFDVNHNDNLPITNMFSFLRDSQLLTYYSQSNTIQRITCLNEFNSPTSSTQLSFSAPQILYQTENISNRINCMEVDEWNDRIYVGCNNNEVTLISYQ